MDSFEYKVTMIVPIYNMEEFLAGCLDSLVNQTISPEEMEIMLIDDGSPGFQSQSYSGYDEDGYDEDCEYCDACGW